MVLETAMLSGMAPDTSSSVSWSFGCVVAVPVLAMLPAAGIVGWLR
jgi:hypothetical protein